MCDHDDLTINDNDKWNYDDQKYKNDDLTYYDNYKCGDNHFYVDDSDKHKVLHEIGSFCMNQANIFKMLHKVLRNLICCMKWGSILDDLKHCDHNALKHYGHDYDNDNCDDNDLTHCDHDD